MEQELGDELCLPERPTVTLSMLSRSQLSVLAGLDGFAQTGATTGTLRDLVWQTTKSTSRVHWGVAAVKVQRFEQLRLACSASVRVAHRQQRTPAA